MFVPARRPQWIVIVGIHFHIYSGLRLSDVLEWGLVRVGIHHETVVRPSPDQGADDAGGWSCRYFDPPPADAEDTQNRQSCCRFQSFALHCETSKCGVIFVSSTRAILRLPAREVQSFYSPLHSKFASEGKYFIPHEIRTRL